MKRNFIMLLTLVFIVAAVCGCSADMTMSINSDGSGTMTRTILIEKEYVDSGEISLEDDVTYEDVTINGVAYKKGTKTDTFSKITDITGAEDTSSCFNNKYFYLRDKSPIATGNSSSSAELAMKNMLQINYSITFPFEVKKTSGKLQSDKKTVIWDNDLIYKNQPIWAVFDDSILDPSNAEVKINGVEDGKYYNRDVLVNGVSNTLVDGLIVNGKNVGSDSCQIITDGKYTVICSDVTGKTITSTFVVDKTKPAVKGVTNGLTYRTSKIIKFSDKYGVKSATLNGKNISSGKKVSKSGTYKLVVTDKAGNKRVVKFKIK